MAQAGNPTGIPSGPKEDRPPASDFDDGTRWNLVLDDGTIVHQEVSGDTWVKTDEEFGTATAAEVNAADALNSEIGDSVDYLDPFWMVKSDHLIVWQTLDDANGHNTFSSNSANLSFGAAGAHVSTGTTADSQAQTQYTEYINESTWDNDRVWETAVDIQSTAELLGVGMGRFDIVEEANAQRVYFLIRNGSLEGAVNDGSGMTTTTLISSFSTGGYTLQIRWYAGDRVEFWVNGTEEGSITSGLPTGDNKAQRWFMTEGRNPGGTDADIYSRYVRGVQR